MNLDHLKHSGLKIIPRAPLKDYTTFRLGGPCLALILCETAAQLTLAVSYLRATQTPFIMIGFGSNILAADAGVETVIVRYSSKMPLITKEHDTLTVDAATQLDALAAFAIENGLEGMTCFSGIPGTVGGAIAGNAGAYGQQISGHLVDITILQPDNTVAILPKELIHFEYRDSAIKHNGAIILSARFTLPAGDPTAMKKNRAGLIDERHSKHGHWEENPCAGSFFRNVEPTSNAGPRQSAGGVIEAAGAKNLMIGKAHPYPKHANIITRDEGATAQDVYDLTTTIAAMVKAKFGVKLVREVRLLGKFNNGLGDPQGFW